MANEPKKKGAAPKDVTVNPDVTIPETEKVGTFAGYQHFADVVDQIPERIEYPPRGKAFEYNIKGIERVEEVGTTTSWLKAVVTLFNGEGKPDTKKSIFASWLKEAEASLGVKLSSLAMLRITRNIDKAGNEKMIYIAV